MDAGTPHGLSGSDARFQNVPPIVVVSKNCVTRVEVVVMGPKRGVFVSWKRIRCTIELLAGLFLREKAED